MGLGIKELVTKLKLVFGNIKTKKTKATNSNFMIPDNTGEETKIIVSENTGQKSNYTYNNCKFETYKEMIDYKNLKKYIDSLYEKQEAKKREQKVKSSVLKEDK